MIIWKNFSHIFILNSYPLCNKKGGRLIVARIFINGFFYVVLAKTHVPALFFIHWSGEEKKDVRQGVLFTKVTFSLTFFYF